MAIVGNWFPTGNDQQRLTAALRAAIQQLTNATNVLAAIVQVQAQMLAGGSDFSTIETYFTFAPGTGQFMKDIIGTASDTLASSPVQALLQRLG